MFFRNKHAYAIGKESQISRGEYIMPNDNCAETFPGIAKEKRACGVHFSLCIFLPHRQSHPHKPRKQPDHVTHTFIQVNDSTQGQGLGCVRRWRIFNVTGGVEPSVDSKEFLLERPLLYLK